MNYQQIDGSFYDFILAHAKDDPYKLLLGTKNPSEGIDIKFAAIQIECRKKNERKLSVFISNLRFLFPSLLAAEQATHQVVAAYHASLLRPGGSMLDMTAGLGADIFMASGKMTEITAYELDGERASCLKHNLQTLGIANVKVFEGDSVEWIKSCVAKGICYDTIFIDPARRTDGNRRTYLLKDCLPDVTSLDDTLSRAGREIWIKASPILDVAGTMKELTGVAEVHVVCVKGECKEVLVKVIPGYREKDAEIVIIDLKESYKVDADNGIIPVKRHEIRFRLSEEGNQRISLVKCGDDIVGGYIYDPFAGLHKIKSGNILKRIYPELSRMATNTDIYYSAHLYPDFPGRVLKVERICGKEERRQLKGLAAAVVSRNHPMSAQEIEKKFRLKSSSDRFLYAVGIGSASVPTIVECVRYTPKRTKTPE